MPIPVLSRHNCIRSVVGLRHFYIWLLLDSVQVFVQAVQQEIYKFLGVMLIHSLKHRILLAYLSLNLEW